MMHDEIIIKIDSQIINNNNIYYNPHTSVQYGFQFYSLNISIIINLLACQKYFKFRLFIIVLLRKFETCLE